MIPFSEGANDMNKPDTVAGREKLDSLARQIASQLSTNGSPRPALAPRPAASRNGSSTIKPELAAAIEAIARAADLMSERDEQISASEVRAQEQDGQIDALSRQLAQTETRLRAALDEAQREHNRADDLERRSNELLDRTQAMLTEASERLVAAETRAEHSEESLNQLQAFILERLTF